MKVADRISILNSVTGLKWNEKSFPSADIPKGYLTFIFNEYSWCITVSHWGYIGMSKAGLVVHQQNYESEKLVRLQGKSFWEYVGNVVNDMKLNKPELFAE
jgi:hypothetical protein